MISDRRVEVDGAFNVRDLGGLSTKNHQIRTGLVFRADSPRHLTDRGVDTVRRLELGTVIDLRSGVEAEEGSWAVDETAARHIFDVMDIGADPRDREILREVDEEAFAGFYVDRVEHGAETFAQAARTVIEAAEQRVLFHCTAGKDRTGILAAFLLAALGVDNDTIADDYAASDERLELRDTWLRDHPDVDTPELGNVPELLTRAPRLVMERFLQLMSERHGGIVNHFATNGLTDDHLARWRATMLLD